MTEAFNVDPAQLRRHAARVREVRDQLGAIKAASRSMAQDDAAYGLLCGWIAAILEARHGRQDQLYDYVEENLALAAQSLATASANYESADTGASDRLRRAGRMG